MKCIHAVCVALVAALGVGCAPARSGAVVSPTASTSPGKAGSMARFIAHRDHLYALDGSRLIVYDTAFFGLPREVHRIHVPAAAETLFPYGELLFVGTRQGMLVYSVVTPAEPELIGRADHVYSCDPVVVEDDVAYVTLRSGAGCRQGVSMLLVYDVRSPTEPRQISGLPLASPHGLGVDGDVLFVADAVHGLLVLDVREPHDPKPLAMLPEVVGYDLIADDGLLFVSAEDGLYQYAYDQEGLTGLPVSRIPIGESKGERPPPEAMAPSQGM